MINSRITGVTIHLDGHPDDVTLHLGQYPVLQIGSAVTIHVGETSPATLLAVAAALTEAAADRQASRTAIKAVAA